MYEVRGKFKIIHKKKLPGLYKPCIILVQNVLSSRLLPKNAKIRLYKTIILPLVLYEG
jgi:hypothetical protein